MYYPASHPSRISETSVFAELEFSLVFAIKGTALSSL
jgi:hypothetical protein